MGAEIDINWLSEEGVNVSIGDKFIVKQIDDDMNNRWIGFTELYFSHPIEKFRKVSKKKESKTLSDLYEYCKNLLKKYGR